MYLRTRQLRLRNSRGLSVKKHSSCHAMLSPSRSPLSVAFLIGSRWSVAINGAMAIVDTGSTQDNTNGTCAVFARWRMAGRKEGSVREKRQKRRDKLETNTRQQDHAGSQPVPANWLLLKGRPSPQSLH
jgi:hypothetical protein